MVGGLKWGKYGGSILIWATWLTVIEVVTPILYKKICKKK